MGPFSGQHATCHVVSVQQDCLIQFLKLHRKTDHDSVDSALLLSQLLTFSESTSEPRWPNGMCDLESASHHTGRSGVGFWCAGNHRSSRMRYLPHSFVRKRIIPLRQPSNFSSSYELFHFHLVCHGRIPIFLGDLTFAFLAGYLDFMGLNF